MSIDTTRAALLQRLKEFERGRDEIFDLLTAERHLPSTDGARWTLVTGIDESSSQRLEIGPFLLRDGQNARMEEAPKDVRQKYDELLDALKAWQEQGAPWPS